MSIPPPAQIRWRRYLLATLTIAGLPLAAPAHGQVMWGPEVPEERPWTQARRELPPLRLSTAELGAILDSITSLVEELSPADTVLRGRNELELTVSFRDRAAANGMSSVTGSDPDSVWIAVQGRDVGYVTFVLREHRQRHDGRFWRIRIGGGAYVTLGPHGNRIAVNGYDRERNERVVAAAESMFLKHRSSFGSAMGKHARAACLVLGVVLVPLAAVRRTSRSGLIVIALGMLFIALNMFAPFETVFREITIHAE